MRFSYVSTVGFLLALSSAACTTNPTEDEYLDDSANDLTELISTSVQSLSACQSPGGALVPTMSSNTSPSGLVTQSGVYGSGYEGWQAFDDTTATLWLSNMYTSSVWLGYEWGGGTSKTVSSYEIKYANGSCCEQRGPKNWTLQGWNGSTWITVDTVTNQTGWYAYSVRTYSVDTPGTYSKYRLNVTADNYNNATYPITLVSIASLQLYGAVSAPQVPTMSSSTTPSGYVTRSGVYSSAYEGWQAFDATTATLWLSNMYTSSVWLGYEWGGGTSKVVTSYEIKYANGSCCEQRGPKNWTLQGWNGAAWVTVDTVTNESGGYANSIRSFAVDNPGCYSQYRLHVTADNYNNASYPITLVSIATLQLYGY
jgi:hypothetical protein